MSMDLRHGLHIRKSNTNYFIPSVSSANSSALSVFTFRMGNSVRCILSSVNNFNGTILGYVRHRNASKALRLLSTPPKLRITFTARMREIVAMYAYVEDSFDSYQRSFIEALTINVEFKRNGAPSFTRYASFTLPAGGTGVTYSQISFSGSDTTGELGFRVQGFGRTWFNSITGFSPGSSSSQSYVIAVSLSV